MASITRTPDVTETVVVEKGRVVLELSNEEAENLTRLMRSGIGMSTLSAFGLLDLLKTLKAEGLGEMPQGQWRNWQTTAQWIGPNL